MAGQGQNAALRCLGEIDARSSLPPKKSPRSRDGLVEDSSSRPRAQPPLVRKGCGTGHGGFVSTPRVASPRGAWAIAMLLGLSACTQAEPPAPKDASAAAQQPETRSGLPPGPSADSKADDGTSESSGSTVMKGPLHPSQRPRMRWLESDGQSPVYELVPTGPGYDVQNGRGTSLGRIDVSSAGVVFRSLDDAVMARATPTRDGFSVLKGNHTPVLHARKSGAGYIVTSGSGRPLATTRGNTALMELPTLGGSMGIIPKRPPPRPASAGRPNLPEPEPKPEVEIWARGNRETSRLEILRTEQIVLQLEGKASYKAAVMLGFTEELDAAQRLTAYAFLSEFK